MSVSLFKIYVGFFLLNYLAIAETEPSFLFSEKEGLQLIKSLEDRQNDAAQYQESEFSNEKVKKSIDTKSPVKSKLKADKQETLSTQSSSDGRELAASPSPLINLRESKNTASSIKSKSEATQVINSPDQSKQKGKQVTTAPDQPNSDNQAGDSSNLSNSEELPIPQNSLSEEFAPKTEERIQGTDFLDTLSEDVSWFFQEKKTKHKVAITPIFSHNLTDGIRLGLRLFSYSLDEKGYYLALAGSNYLLSPFYRFNASYISNRKGDFRIESSLIYDNHYEEYFGEGVMAKLSDKPTKLFAHRLMADYKIFYQPSHIDFYGGLGLQLFLRRERLEYQKEKKKHFEDEFFLFPKIFAGHDSRDSWKNPKKGAFHTLSFGCKPSLGFQKSFCKGEGDVRFYFSLFKDFNLHDNLKKSVFAFRAFAGSALFSPGSYSMAYSLGGQNPFQNLNTFRGFKQNRFRGDKMYFAQAEIRFPIWEEYIGGVLFTELGEVAGYKDQFKGFVVDYGGGLRFGLPPDYDMKVRFDYGFGYDKQNKFNYDVTVNFLHIF